MSTTIENTTEVKRSFKLPQYKVTVRPILRSRGMITDPKHEGFFLMANSYIEFSCPSRRGNLVCPLTDEERRFFEDKEASGMHFEKGQLTPHADRTKNYWKSRKAKVKLTKDNLVLDLSNGMDYITYKILLSNKSKIATSWSERLESPEYLFAIVKEHEEIESNISKADKMKRAWIGYGKLEGSTTEMRTFLRASGKLVANDSKDEFLKNEISKIIENNVSEFLDIYDNPDYDYLVLLSGALKKKIIIKRNGSYIIKASEKHMSLDGETLANKQMAMEYLKNNDEFRMQIEAILGY